MHSNGRRPRVGLSTLIRCFTFMATATCLLIAPAEARRTVIDENDFGLSFEVTGDAENGEIVHLPFAIDFGTGLQSTASITMGPCCLPADTEDFVGINFSPDDYIFATLLLHVDSGQSPESAVRLSNEQETSTPLDPVDAASIFEFGITQPFTFVPGFPTEETGSVGFYTDLFGSALIQFSDLSASGAPGDFELLLSCSGSCTSIGFSLNGQSFSSLDQPDGSSVFRFIFRNSTSVPEPGTWVMMLLGFGAAGFALRIRSTKHQNEDSPRDPLNKDALKLVQTF